jgi:hypothetical protein
VCKRLNELQVTFYETSHINGTAHFTVTPLPISIENPNRSGSCSGNALATQPQASSALTHSPWLDASGTSVTYPPVSNGAGPAYGAKGCMYAMFSMLGGVALFF